MHQLTDTSVFIGYWPFQPLGHRTAGDLKQHLLSLGVSQAWAASSEAVLYPDPMQGNLPLLDEVAGDPFFMPITVVNPTLATWERDVDYCLSAGCRGLKLVPNYHQYSLNDPNVEALLAVAKQGNVPVCVQLRMMDERTHHPLMRVPGVAVTELKKLVEQHPGVRFLACCIFQSELSRLKGLDNVWAELSYIESSETLANAIATIGDSRLVFGSHSPFLYFQAESNKLKADPNFVSPDSIAKIVHTNAELLLQGR